MQDSLTTNQLASCD